MKTAESKTPVPENTEGKSVDLEESITESNPESAINTFNRICSRLLNPAIWHQLAGALSGEFELVNAAGENPGRLAELNDYIRISIPGPGNKTGDGFDWVKIEKLEENTIAGTDFSFLLQLRSCANPLHTEKGTAHFFKETATSTFVVKRTGHTIIASYHGRNELPNTSGDLTDKIRNTIVASGAALGLSELQWSALLKGLLEKEIGG